jgi:hypothetical protein
LGGGVDAWRAASYPLVAGGWNFRFLVAGLQRVRPEPLEPPLNPPLKPLLPPRVVEFRNDPAVPRLPIPAGPRENPPLTGTWDIPPSRNAGALTAEERPDPLLTPGFTVVLPPLPERDRVPLPRWTDGTPSP